jgi:NAD dependent epimerase/dehydratase
MSSLRGKKCLVTGADGFIGSHLVEQLVRNGCIVRAFCQYNSLGSYGWIDNISPEIRSQLDLVLGDIRDKEFVFRAARDIDIVFHLAALIAIPYSYTAPYSYVETNINGTLNILQACKANSIERLVHTSTSETYGSAQFVPITEVHPLVGQSPYAATKIGADQLALSYWHSFGLPVSIIRPFNTYGPRQSNRAVIPTIISQLASGAKHIKLGSLTPTRDFSYVEDTCGAFISVAESCFTHGRVINCASNFEISIGDTAKLISRIMGTNATIEEDAARLRPETSEVNRLYGSNSLLRDLTEWEPKYSLLEGFERGLERTIEWFRDPENLKYYNPTMYSV